MKEHDFAGALEWLPYSKRLNQPAGGATVWHWLEKYHNEIEHALTLAKKMQDGGYVVVPMEPTQRMVDAALATQDIYTGRGSLARIGYQAMIQAAQEETND